MIRLVVFLVTVALIAIGFAWIADRPGEIVLTWMGYRIETSMTVAAIGVIMLILIVILLWSILRAILRSPEQVSLFFRHRRAMKAYLAISRGLIAAAAGDLRLVRRSADEAERLSPNDPLTLLLTAQSAQLAGNRAGAERVFHEMTQRDETKLLGLRGLYIEAQRRNDVLTARRAAEEATKATPSLAWASQAVLDDRCAASDWSGALAALETMKGLLDKTAYRRRRAVLLTAQAIALEERDRDASRNAVLEAVKLAPDLVPAAALAGRQLTGMGEQRKARRILETAWSLTPHPELAEAYANLRLGDSARERLMRMQKLAALAPGQREGALAVARAALNAQEFAAAHAALAPYLSAPTRRVATLMAAIEELEHGDEGRVREWMNRAMHASPDPVWTADGVVSDHWMPVSPSGQLDGFKWRVPLAEIDGSRPVIEMIPASDHPLASETTMPTPAESQAGKVEATMLGPEIMPESETPHPSPAKKAGTKAADPIIPLIHVPDDPGPDSTLEGEEENSGVTSPEGALQRRRQWF